MGDVPNGTQGQPYTGQEWAAIDQHHREWRDYSTTLAASAVDRDAVKTGDVITWTTRNGGHRARGEVAWTVSTGAYVTIPDRGTYLVEWARVKSLTSK